MGIFRDVNPGPDDFLIKADTFISVETSRPSLFTTPGLLREWAYVAKPLDSSLDPDSERALERFHAPLPDC